MSQQDRKLGVDEGQPCGSGPDEPQSHTEHRAALDATVFLNGKDPYELVFELDSGRLYARDDQAGSGKD